MASRNRSTARRSRPGRAGPHPMNTPASVIPFLLERQCRLGSMQPLAPGSKAPEIPGVLSSDGPRALIFYKVTCPVCQMAAPALQRFERGYPGRVAGVGQDPQLDIDEFASQICMTFALVT